jgi:hypothetical protein
LGLRGWKLYNEELHDLYCPVVMIKCRNIYWWYIWYAYGACRVLVEKLEGERQLGINWHRCEVESELNTWNTAVLIFSHLYPASVRKPFLQVILSKLCMNFCLIDA